MYGYLPVVHEEGTTGLVRSPSFLSPSQLPTTTARPGDRHPLTRTRNFAEEMSNYWKETGSRAATGGEDGRVFFAPALSLPPFQAVRSQIDRRPNPHTILVRACQAWIVLWTKGAGTGEGGKE